ncbi:MAG: bifunctional demethylmenaquinone methyltransferase/2-methoxy-6-polyprenyl-1,4-benzoquinol methylase UbiE [Candidatus Zixiibacteriota bacterium]
MKELVIKLPTESPSRANVYQMFDRISHRYDLLNRILSLGLDIHWRNSAIEELEDERHERVLDLACGTGDVAIAAARANKHRRVVAVDMASQMLTIAQSKIERAGLRERIQLTRGDGMSVPAGDSSFDAASIAFGIRNMPDTLACLREMLRVIRSGGTVVLLEFSLPANTILRKIHLMYLRWVLPVIGKVLSGDNYAYSYLNKTIETYPYGEQFCALMTQTGFVAVKARSLSMGIVTIYTGIKP